VSLAGDMLTMKGEKKPEKRGPDGRIIACGEPNETAGRITAPVD
jgi:hypothetical protein